MVPHALAPKGIDIVDDRVYGTPFTACGGNPVNQVAKVSGDLSFDPSRGLAISITAVI